ncbi:MAG: hypothetical protein ABSG46_01555 [Candidatus Binataceae bacterium]
MKGVDTNQKALSDAVAAVEAEISEHSQQIEALNLRLEGIRRAIELFESDRPAIIEMLQISPATSAIPAARAVVVIPRWQATKKPQVEASNSAPAGRIGRQKSAAIGAAKRHTRSTQAAGGLKRVDMIAEILRRTPGLSTRELVIALGKDFGWECTERNVTAHLYTNRRFQRSTTHRSGKKVVIWSLK